MSRSFRTFALIVFFSGISAFTQTRTLTNSDIAEMVKAELSESTIVLTIQQSKPNFDLSPEALIKLKKEGASQNVLDAMLKTSTPAVTGSLNEDAFGTSVGSSVTLIDRDNRKGLKRMTPTSKTNDAVRVIPYVGIFMKGKTYAVFQGKQSDVRTENPSPVFEIGISSDLKISDAVYIVRLESTKTTRRSEVERKGDIGGSTGPRKKDLVPISIEEIVDRKPSFFGITFYRIKLSTALTPGEYALVVNGNLFYDFGVDVVL